MKKAIILAILVSFISVAGYVIAMDGMEGMSHGSEKKSDTFMHSDMTDGIHVEFQVMELAKMNMVDPDGKTHHVMASFTKDGEKITKAVGKIKIIAPSGREEIADLKDYGGGAFAANFNIDEKGKWGIICLFKDEEGKHTTKFWYGHQDMQH